MSLYQKTVINGERAGPRLLIIAGVHGDECEPMVAVSRLREQLAPQQLAGTTTLIPLANESAFQRASRVGEDGLDLARTFPGRSDGTVTQRLAAELSQEINSSDYLIDLHTGGRTLQILPMTGFMLHADEKIVKQQRQMADWFNLPIVWGTSAEHAGRSLSAARDANVPAIYAEFGGGGAFRGETVDAYLAGCLQVLAGLEMIAPRQYVGNVQHRIDDSQSGSGHLQVCHPAPCDGIFVPSVALGNPVREGETIGRVFARPEEPGQVITADHDGVVLVLYVAPQVAKGTGLCVLVKADRQE